jgi:hypothetical protein
VNGSARRPCPDNPALALLMLGIKFCPGSGHMRRGGISAAEGAEILGWRLAVEGVVRPVVVEAVREGVDEGLQLVEAVRQVVAGVELVSP